MLPEIMPQVRAFVAKVNDLPDFRNLAALFRSGTKQRRLPWPLKSP